MTRRIVYVNWAIASYFGWGVYGLNLALNWSQDPDIEPVGGCVLRPEHMVVDPALQPLVDRFIARSAAFHARLVPFANQPVTVEGVVIDPSDEHFQPQRSAHGVTLSGKPSILATFFETTKLTPDAITRAARYPLIVAGSTWNAEILRAHGLKNVRTVVQGIEPSLFHPGPRLGLYPDRFVVFSGGKLERRKGQDIVIAAFRQFSQRHPDALLVTIWNNGWAKNTSTINEGDIAAPVPFGADGTMDLQGWVAANGIADRNFVDLGFIPNSLLPGILREMDVAVFPNRAEGGTNLVAMECMATGIPTILSRNTGHLDLFEDDNCFSLDQQGVLEGREGGIDGVAGWGESDVNEVVEALERVYAHREEARQRGARGAATVGRLTWAKSAADLKALVLASWT